MTPDEIAAKYGGAPADGADAIAAKYGGKPVAETPPLLEFAKKVAPFGMGGFFIDAAMGVKQAVDAGAQMAARATGLGVEQTEAANKYSKDAYEASGPQDRPGASLVRGGAVGAGLAAMLPPAAAATLPRVLASGAGLGGAGSILEPVYDAKDDADFWSKKRGQLAEGAVAGGVTAGGSRFAANMISPVLGQAQKILADAGIRMTPGQLSGGTGKAIEDRLAGFPVIGDLIQNARASGILDFNKAVYAKAVEPFADEGAALVRQVPVGRKGVAAVGDFLSSKYEQALAKSVPSPVTHEFQDAMMQLSQMVPEAKRADFINAVNRNITLTPAGTVTPSTAKAAESELGRLYRQYSGSSVADDREYALALAQAQSNLRDLFAANNPEAAPLIQAANKGWATLVQLERAASMVGAKDGVISPAQFTNAVKRGDNSPRDRQFARGEALNQEFADAAKSVLPSSVPDSGTAGRLALGATIANAPAAIAHIAGSPGTALAMGAAMLPYLPGVGPAITAARLSPQAVRLADLVRRLAPGLGASAAAVTAP